MDYFAADHHFYHSKIITFCNRPFTHTAEMNHELIRRHNQLVTNSDRTFFIGDVFWGDNWKQLASILNRMNGSKVLVVGNHDHLRIWDYVEAGFSSVHTYFTYNDFILVHDPAVACIGPTKKFIHGHTHNLGLKLSDHTYSVSVEMHDYYPVSIEKIIEEF